jgi:PRC-barrel domain protein
MLRTIMAATAVSALALTSALAQSTTAPSTAPSTTAQTTAPAGHATFVSQQAPDQWLASKFRGTDVVGANEEKIGDVSDVLFTKDGKILAYVVGVGGFLGIGSKDVAIDPASFQLVPGKDASDYKLRLSMSKDELKAAAKFEPYAPPRPTVSQNPASPMTTRPSSNKQ